MGSKTAAPEGARVNYRTSASLLHRSMPNLAVIASICATFLFSSPAAAQRFGKMDGSVHRAARSADRSGERAPAEVRRMARSAPTVSLGRLSDSEARPVTRKPGLAPVGVSRPIPAEMIAKGEWSASAEGKPVWRLTLASTGAEALRVRFADFHVAGGKVWLIGTDSDGAEVTAGPYSNDGPMGDGEFWSDMLAGESMTLVYEPADGASTDVVPFRPADLSHRFPVKKATKTADDPAARSTAASCAVDVSCHPEYSDAASAVALMIFESDGGTYECTGSLISSASQPALPFFLTANHCIGTAAEARSLMTFFNYQTSSCNGTRPTLSNAVRVNGATLVIGQSMALGDFSLLQLSGFPNVDVKVLGWTADEIASNEQVTGISHPAGDYKRIALGRRTRDVTIRFSDGARMPASVGYQVAWFEGLTEGGSSGSPLLVNMNGKNYLVGTLSAGPDVNEDDPTEVCRANNLVASYGRFSAAAFDLGPYLTSTDGGVSSRSPVSSTPTLTAAPLTLGVGQTAGRTTLTWQASGVGSVQIRVGSPTGPAMTGFEGPTGSASTGDWAVDGMSFYLQDASDGDSLGSAKTLAIAQVRAMSTTSGIRSGFIGASPNPIGIIAGQTASTTLNWRATGVSRVQVRVGSPTGTPMTGFESPTGSATTGDWVTNGLTFYLQDATDGFSSGISRTLSAVRVNVVAR